MKSPGQICMEFNNALDEGLPRAYTKELFAKKAEVLFEHVYEAYQGDGASIYAGSP